MKIQLGDGINSLLSLKPGSASLVLSDLPSGETKAPFDKKADLTWLWPAVWAALKPNGVACLMASSLGFACEIRSYQLKNFRYDLVWRKSLATGHLNAQHRPLRIHEFVLVFWRAGQSPKNKTTYQPQMLETGRAIHAATRTSHGQNYGPHTKITKSRAGATDRYPVSVLDFASVGTSSSTRVHPQQKPVDLMKWLIATYTRPGELVVDPYAGSGATGIAAEELGRKFTGWDTSPRFASP